MVWSLSGSFLQLMLWDLTQIQIQRRETEEIPATVLKIKVSHASNQAFSIWLLVREDLSFIEM